MIETREVKVLALQMLALLGETCEECGEGCGGERQQFYHCAECTRACCCVCVLKHVKHVPVAGDDVPYFCPRCGTSATIVWDPRHI